MTDQCKHLSEFRRVCELPRGHEGLHQFQTVRWPSRPWGWSHERNEYAS